MPLGHCRRNPLRHHLAVDLAGERLLQGLPQQFGGAAVRKPSLQDLVDAQLLPGGAVDAGLEAITACGITTGIEHLVAGVVGLVGRPDAPRWHKSRGLQQQPNGITVVRLTTLQAMSQAEPVLVSASEANRSFSALLRQVAEGQSFTVQSHGRPVATLAPVQTARPSLVSARQALLARLAAQPASGEPRTWRREELYD